MEVIVVLAIAGVVAAIAVVGLGSVFGRSRKTDELRSERGARGQGASPHEGMGTQPQRDRPAGPGAEAQDPNAGEWHPPEQRGAPPDEAARPSDAAGKRDPGAGEDRG